MRLSSVKYAAVTAFAAGIILAQAPSGNSQPPAANPQGGPHSFMGGHLGDITQVLNLTDSQKEQARMIFEQAGQSAQPILQDLKENREKLDAAAKATNSEGDIQKLATEQGRLLGQLIAIHTVATAKFFQMLTPEQRAKADQMHEQLKERPRSGEGKNGP